MPVIILAGVMTPSQRPEALPAASPPCRSATVRRVVTLPGVSAAALAVGVTADVSLAEVTPAAVETAARSVTAAVDRRGGLADENTLIRAQQTLERGLSGTFDVLASVADGVRLVELADATGRRHLAGAAADLTPPRRGGPLCPV
jgi:hypothetical protein